MRTRFTGLKQAEMFSLLAMLFLLMIVYERSSRLNAADAKQNIPISIEKKNTYPPTIPISSQDLSFESRSAFPEEGPEHLKDYIKNNIVPEIEEQLREYNVDMIEVVGHTDGESIGGTGDLDKSSLNNLARLGTHETGISDYSQLVEEFKDISAGSNADLGLIRALVVVKTLEYLRDSGECECNVKAFRAYSAGQLYLPSESLAAPPDTDRADPFRRRIEIRFTRWSLDE